MSSSEDPGAVWFVNAEERIYGPFGQDRLPQFVAERRLSERTLVSTSVIGPFAPAGEEPRLRFLFEPAEAAPDAGPFGAAAPTASGPTAQQPTATPGLKGTSEAMEAEPRPFLHEDAQGAGASLDLARPLIGAAPEPPSSLLVVADLASATHEEFRARLARFGAVDVIARGAYLVTAPLSAALLRTTVSRGLGPEDRVLVVELHAATAAWFNLPELAERLL